MHINQKIKGVFSTNTLDVQCVKLILDCLAASELFYVGLLLLVDDLLQLLDLSRQHLDFWLIRLNYFPEQKWNYVIGKRKTRHTVGLQCAD